MTNLLSVQEAQARILEMMKTTISSEPVAVDVCRGRILAETISAPGDLPPFDNSSMDGFALRAADIQQASREQPVVLRVTGDIPAGASIRLTIDSGQAARIMTGAPLPDGADSVIPIEDTDLFGEQFASLPGQVSVFRPVKTGDYVRPRGQDVQEGHILLDSGRRIQPQDAGLLASIGLSQVRVYRRPRVAIFSSGDELVQPGNSLGPGQIYDANQYVLAALLEQEGAEVLRLGTARDNPDEIYRLLCGARDQAADLIVTSAGVSVGAFDYVRQVIETHGQLSFWRVNMRPGKPLAFGTFEKIPLIGLPGNPVSAYVGCRVFVLPAVRRLSGSTETPTRLKAVLAHPVESDGRESYLRAIVREESGQRVAQLTGHQGSGNLYALVQANALLIVPSGVKSLPSGSEVDIWFLSGN